MATFVGRVTVLDEQLGPIGTVGATLATTGETGGAWFGLLPTGLAGLVSNGDRVWVQLPNGLQGEARVIVDLTGAEPVIRLRGVGRAPL